MNLPGAAAPPVSLACGDPFTARLPDQPGQHISGEVPAFRLGPRPAHTVIMTARELLQGPNSGCGIAGWA